MIHQSTTSTQHRHTRTTPIFAPGRVRPIGQVVDHVFLQRRKPEHFLSSPPAIAFDVSVLDAAERAGATVAEIHNSETGAVWTATFDLIRSKGFPVKRGFGHQWALALGHWSLNGQPSELQRQAEQQAAKAATAAVQQLGLFGGAE